LKPQFTEIVTYRGNQFKVKFGEFYGIIDSNLNWLIPPQYDGIEFTHLPDIFIVTKDFYKVKGDIWSGGYTRYGLAKIHENVILPLIYKQIQKLNWRSSVFLVETGHPNPVTQEEGYRDGHFGLFDAYKGLIIDTVYSRYLCKNSGGYSAFSYSLDIYKDKSYIIFKNPTTNKTQIFDHFGTALFSTPFDEIEFKTDDMASPIFMCGNGTYSYIDRNFYPDFGYLILQNKGKSGVYDLDKKQWTVEMNKYDTIATWLFRYDDKTYRFFFKEIVNLQESRMSQNTQIIRFFFT
jgi:hypothetical protein